jgi:hypothetical protein
LHERKEWAKKKNEGSKEEIVAIKSPSTKEDCYVCPLCFCSVAKVCCCICSLLIFAAWFGVQLWREMKTLEMSSRKMRNVYHTTMHHNGIQLPLEIALPH